MILLRKFCKKQLFSQISPLKIFQQRNLLYQHTSDDLSDPDFVKNYQKKSQNKCSLYCGYDPTNDSLHIGNLVSIIMLAKMSLLKMNPIFLIGGATGMIGDPSGKSKERNLLDEQKLNTNIIGINNDITRTYKNILSHLQSKKKQYNIEQINYEYQIINNRKYYDQLNVINFLRDIGKYFRMNVLIAKQNVSKRLNSQQGISYTQFSYSLMQAYDFLMLNKQKNCILQIGGSDQWGNITNGIDLVKKSAKKQVYGITIPLLVTNSGQKFGKSEGNALYLNKDKTKTSEIYQYFFNTPDNKVIQYLKIFTFMPLALIQQIEKKHIAEPQKRIAHKILCEQILCLITDEKVNHAQKNTFFFKTTYDQFKKKSLIQLDQIFSKIDKKQINQISRDRIRQLKNFVQLIHDLKLKNTKAEIRRQVQKGGVYINNLNVSMNQCNQNLSLFLEKHLLCQKYLIVRFGKKNYKYICII